nr:retrovirus-related Pol polyprotein from transposon TNT 1-94 [Tanacetum cinerariifolium]
LPSEWKTYTLIWRNKANLEEHSLDDLFNSLRIYEAEVKHSSTPGNPTQNLAFVSFSNTDSTTDSVSAPTSVSAVCAQLPMSSHPTIDSLSNAIIFSFFAGQSTSPQLDNEDLKQIDVDDLEEMDLRWQMAMLTMRTRRKGHFAKECRSPKDTRRTGAAEPQRRNTLVKTSTTNALVSQCDGIGSYDWSYQAEEEPANFTLMAITSSSTSFDNEVQSCSKACSKAYDQLHSQYDKLTVEFRKSQIDVLSYQAGLEYVEARLVIPTKHAQDMTHTTRPMAPIIEDWVSDLEDESEPNDPSSVPGFVLTYEHVKPSGHSIQPIEAPIFAATPKPTSSNTNSSGKRKNRKTCFMCRSVDHLIKDCNFHAKPKTQPTQRNYAHKGYNKQHASFTKKYPQKHIVPAAVLNKSKPVYVTAVRPVSAVVPKIMVTRPRHAHSLNTRSNSTIRRHKTRSQSSKTNNSSSKVSAVKAQVVSAAKGKKEKWVWRPKCLILDHDSSASKILKRFDYNDALGRSKYVAFGGNPKGGKISGKGMIKTCKLDFEDVYFVKELKFNFFSVSQICDKKNKVPFTDSECLVLSPNFKLPDESQVLLRVPRENNMYNVNLKDIVPSGDLTCLFAKATTGESNLWHRRLGHDETSPILKTFITGLENQLRLKVKVIRSDNGTEFKIFDLNQFCELKGIKREFSVPRTPQQNGIAERKNKTLIENRVLVTKPHNKTPYELLHGRTLSIGFMIPFGCPITILNTLDPLGKFEGKVDEGFLNKEGDAAFDVKEHDAEKPESAVNLSPSSSAFSEEQDDMTKKKDKGKSLVEYFTGNRDLNTYFEYYSEDSSNNVSAAGPIVPTAGQNCSNSTNPISAAEEPKRVYQALKDPSWIEAMQEELLQFKMQKVWILVDLSHGKRAIERIEAIRLFLAYASFMGFMVYQMDVKSAFLYGTIEEEVYVFQPPRLLELADERQVSDEFNGGTHILSRSSGKSASTLIDIEKPLLKDPDGEDVDVHIYRSKIGSLMYLTSSRPDIMFAWPTQTVIIRVQAWIKKSTTGGCQFLGRRLISWQCKKQTVVATSSTEAKYVAGASCCAQVLWIQNQMLNYGKSDASKGFNQIINFLNGSYIEYALTVNPTIYVSCIKQFWNTVTIKQSNDITRLQALVDKKKVVVTEATIRDALHLDDTEGVDCLPNEEFFTELARMGYKKPSTKLTFYKAFFSSQWNLVRNVDSSSKFYMHPRFIHLIIQNQLGNLSTHTTNYISLALTQKVFANMRRVGKGCLGVETSLFEGMLVVREPEEQGDAEEQGNDDNVAEEPVTAISEDEGRIIDKLDKDKGVVLMRKNEEKETGEVKDITGDAQVEGRHEAVEVVTTAKLITEVVAAVSEMVSDAAVVPTVTTAVVLAAIVTPTPVKVVIPSTRRRREVVIRDP